ncbi:MAG: lipid-A-disaccharide synthase [Alphaproteobacteria bacterium]
MRVFLVAGEVSGDLLGAELMEEISHYSGEPVEYFGIGGARMAAAGQQQMADLEALAIFGIVDGLRSIPRIKKLLRRTASEVRRLKADVLVTIDIPDFAIHLSRALEGEDIFRVQYVCPAVWVWRQWRAAKFARHYELLLSVLRFDAACFTPYGGRVSFVGHPAVWRARQQVENVAATEEPEETQTHLGIKEGALPLLFLPGSRRSELRHNLPLMVEALHLLAKKENLNLHIISPVRADFTDEVRSALQTLPWPANVSDSEETKWRAFRLAHTALAVSGTVTLELTAALIPMVALYNVSTINYHLNNLFILNRVRQYGLSLPNLVAEERIIADHLRRPLRSQTIADNLASLLKNPDHHDKVQKKLESVSLKLVAYDSTPPSQRAAKEIYQRASRS